MIAASLPVKHPPLAKLLVVRRDGRLEHRARSALARLLRRGDLVVANDAATLPASLFGTHAATGRPLEVRLAGGRALATSGVSEFVAVVFGAGDFRTRTEDRPAPPALHAGDRLALGPLRAVVAEMLGHPRFVALRFEGSSRDIWEGIARCGRPIQYAHLAQPLELWDAWTALAGPPVAFEPPSAGFALSWSTLDELCDRGVRFATLTHAAGISSTGDPGLDARLPLDEPYFIPASTAQAVNAARFRGGRVVAIGTTVVRALEHAALLDGDIAAGANLATQKLGCRSTLRIVDGMVSGTHERGSSHHELLRAFVDGDTLARMDDALERGGYLTHEFGDSILVEKAPRRAGRGEPGWKAPRAVGRPEAAIAAEEC
jgi:S-adenosylmethionine:tRNA ribosyltransferase-isomerase